MKLALLLTSDAVLWVCALSTGVQAWYLVAIALALIPLISFLSCLWALNTVRAEMKGVRPRAERGEEWMTLITVRYASLFPVANVSLTVGSPGDPRGSGVIRIPASPFREKQYRYRIRCAHRGSYETGILRLSVTDLFSLVCLSRASGKKLLRVDVLPRVPEEPLLEIGGGDQGPEEIRRSDEDTASPSDVRAWQEGDPLKRVHWKLTLRRRELTVRTYEESARPDTLVVPDLSEVNALRDRALSAEDCVCECALGSAAAQLKAGYPVRMPLMSKRPSEVTGRTAADLPAFRDALMRADFDSPYAYEQVLAQMLTRSSRTGGMVLVTPRLNSRTADLALRIRGTGIRVRVIRVCFPGEEQRTETDERLSMQGVAVELRSIRTELAGWNV